MSFDMLPLLSLGLAILVQTAIIAFFLGKISQRMTSAEKRIGEQDTKIATKIEDQSALVEKVTRLTVEMEHNNKSLDKLCAEMTGVQRQLGNIAMNRVGHGGEMS